MLQNSGGGRIGVERARMGSNRVEISDFTNLELFKSNVIMARRLGFEGGSCIHPKQVSILNKAFTPTRAEIERSEQIIAAYSTALASGEGVIALEGKMIDLAIVARAKRILATRDSIYSKLRKMFLLKKYVITPNKRK